MSIEAEITVTLAEVSVNDDYQVEVNQRRRAVAYSPDEAVKLANEIVEVATRAATMLREDLAPRPTLAHAFDLVPSCRDCREGKHGACIGSAFIENGADVDEVECVCSKVDHAVLGGAA